MNKELIAELMTKPAEDMTPGEINLLRIYVDGVIDGQNRCAAGPWVYEIPTESELTDDERAIYSDKYGGMHVYYGGTIRDIWEPGEKWARIKNVTVV